MDLPPHEAMMTPSVRLGDVVYLSGHVMPEAGDLKAQTDALIQHMITMAKRSGGSERSFVQMHVYLTDTEVLSEVNQVLGAYLHKPYPARTVIYVQALPEQARIMMDAVLHLG